MSTARADRVLTRLQNELGLTPDGKAWLTAALDPFHDEAISNLNGLPDGANSRSCVQIVRSSKQVSCPISVTTGTWDCHVVSFPFFGQGPSGLTQQLQPGYYALGNTGNDLDLFISNSDPTKIAPIFVGGVTAYCNATSAGKCGPQTTLQTISQNLNNSFMKGSYRVIAKGFEICATGPDLYQSGSVALYKQPVPGDTSTTAVSTIFFNDFSGTLTSQAVIPSKIYDMVPETYSEINLIPDTKTWKAKQGCYVVDNLNAESFLSYSNIAAAPVYVDRSLILPGNAGVQWQNAYGTTVEPDVAVPPTFVNPITLPLYNTNGVSNFHHSGAYFTGLNLQDTLTINTIWYVERFPSTKESDLEVLARPTPLRDDIALKIYSHCLESMPVGMPFDANFLGGWFDDIIDSVKDFVSPVASALGDIIPGPIGMIAKGVGAITKKEKKKMAVNNSPSPVSTQNYVVSKPNPPVVVKSVRAPAIPVRQQKRLVSRTVPKKSK